MGSMYEKDIYEFTKFCNYFPMKQGMLVWGYFKMVLLTYFTYNMILPIIIVNSYSTFTVTITALLITDMLFNFFYIVAVHLKHFSLFQVYYYYSLCLLSFLFALAIYFTYKVWESCYAALNIVVICWIILYTFAFFLPVFVIQGYVTLLVRSEMRELIRQAFSYDDSEYIDNSDANPSMSVDKVPDNIIAAPVQPGHPINTV